jgi:hypothetical protein
MPARMGHHEGMDHVGFAGLAQLAFVQLGCDAESLLDRCDVVARAILADLVFQFVKQLFDAIGRRRYGWNFGGGGYLWGH